MRTASSFRRHGRYVTRASMRQLSGVEPTLARCDAPTPHAVPTRGHTLPVEQGTIEHHRETRAKANDRPRHPCHS